MMHVKLSHAVCVCPSVTVLLHLVYYPRGSSLLKYPTGFPYCLRLNNTVHAGRISLFISKWAFRLFLLVGSRALQRTWAVRHFIVFKNEVTESYVSSRPADIYEDQYFEDFSLFFFSSSMTFTQKHRAQLQAARQTGECLFQVAQLVWTSSEHIGWNLPPQAAHLSSASSRQLGCSGYFSAVLSAYVHLRKEEACLSGQFQELPGASELLLLEWMECFMFHLL